MQGEFDICTGYSLSLIVDYNRIVDVGWKTKATSGYWRFMLMKHGGAENEATLEGELGLE